MEPNFLIGVNLEFPHWLQMIKKIKPYWSDAEEGDKVQGSDKHNIQHAGGGIPTLTGDVNCACLQQGYCNFIEIVFTCELLSSFQQLSKSCLG